MKQLIIICLALLSSSIGLTQNLLASNNKASHYKNIAITKATKETDSLFQKIKEIQKEAQKSIEYLESSDQKIAKSKSVQNAIKYQKQIFDRQSEFEKQLKEKRAADSHHNYVKQSLDTNKSAAKSMEELIDIVTPGKYDMNDYERLQMAKEIEDQMALYVYRLVVLINRVYRLQ